MTWNKNSIFYLYDRAVPWKDLLIYPVVMSDFILFQYCVESIIIDKNSIPDAKIIGMSYLEYLYYLYYVEKNSSYIGMFDGLLRLVLRKTDAKNDEFLIRYGSYNEQGKPIFTIEEKIETEKIDENGNKNIAFEIKKSTYDSNDFDEIKKIICEQNMVEVPNEMIEKSLRDEIKKQREYRQEMAGWKPCDLEEEFMCIAAAIGIMPEEIYKMTVRKFMMLVRRMDELIHYKIYMAAKMSGMVTFEDKKFPFHWMRDLSKKSEFEGLAFDMESMENKISNDGKVNIANKKKNRN